VNTTESEQPGQQGRGRQPVESPAAYADPRLRRLTEGYRKIMEGAPVAFPPRIAELYAPPPRRGAARGPDDADLLLDGPPES
jgi:hypothetical protein